MLYDTGAETMNINIYLEDALANSLNVCAKRFHKPRNALIREAVKEWILHHEVTDWPKSIVNFSGIPGATAFESHRKDLLPPDEDPFA